MKRILFGICMLSMGNLAWAQSAPPLGSARSFAVLAADKVTNTGSTVIEGNVGVSAGTGIAISGFPPGTLIGGKIHTNDAAAIAAQADARNAYNTLAGESCGTNLSNMNLGGKTLTPGVYCFTAGANLTGTLILNGKGVYVFQVGSALNPFDGSTVSLTNGATAENVFWQVSSANFGAGTTLVGNIFANTGDVVLVGGNVHGRVFALGGAVTLGTSMITEPAPAVAGRWEIVHTSGDSIPQTDLYPGSFSTFLSADGTGYKYGTFTNSICVIDAEATNVVTTWTSLGGNDLQITIAVNNLGLGPDFSFAYTGTYDPLTPVPGDPTLFILAISGTYFATGDVSGCSLTTPTSPGNFVATFLPTISSGSAMGSLDSFNADNNGPATAFDASVDATITFSAPPADGQIAGTVALSSNPMFGGRACFAAPSGVMPLTINPNRSSQSGTSLYIFAEGLDPQTVPTTLFLNGASVNVYATSLNSDPNATVISATESAVTAAIGEDNPNAGTAGVINDGTNNVMAFSYGVIGGACDGAGGVDAPFSFLSDKPIVHKHKKPFRHGHRHRPNRERGRTRDNDNRYWR